MNNRYNPLNTLFLVLMLFLFMGCAKDWYPREAVEDVRAQDIEGFPYHPLVYHLDLSIFSYQLYGQTLAWAFDPYFEESDKGKGRIQLMEKVRAWAKEKGAEQVELETGLSGYRGPGILNGFEDNPSHDPIIYRYDQLHPWSPNITNALNSWTEYLVPSEITSSIRDVYMCYQKTGKSTDAIALEKISPGQKDYATDARDVLLAFEGGTGDKGVEGQPPSQSMMGFVLLRYQPGSDDFDVHIVFRGSRSGSGSRAALQALSDNRAQGNPDWITDLGFDLLEPETGGGVITQIGGVSRGMTTCMKSIFPNLFHCLEKVAEMNPGATPRRIFVTGHSLGAGLAQVFVSALFLGDQYSPNGTGNAMPEELRRWPWKNLKLITFSAPRVGDAVWAKKLTTTHLASDFFTSLINPFDKDAIQPTETAIIPKLLAFEQPSGFRILIPSDPITTEKIPGGKHVGKTVYVSKRNFFDWLPPPDFKAHEPVEIRRHLITGLNDPRIPETAWKYRKMTDLNPDRDKSKKGSRKEYMKIVSSMKRYYRENNIYVDTTRLKSNFDLFLKIYAKE